jgi:outer membrane lipoprotein SlyB
MTHSTPRLRTFQLALLASAALGLSACSRSGSDVAAPTAAASAPEQVAVAPAAPVAPVNSSVAVAPPPPATVIAQNESTYTPGPRGQAGREPPPRADRDVDVTPPSEVDQQRRRHRQQVAAASCSDCGVVEAIHAVRVEAKTSGVGAVAGGVGGALVGNSIAGRHDRAIGGIVGAVGGSLLGNAIEKHERMTTVYDVNVRMSDGSLRTVRQSRSPAVGERVRVEADGLHARA